MEVSSPFANYSTPTLLFQNAPLRNAIGASFNRAPSVDSFSAKATSLATAPQFGMPGCPICVLAAAADTIQQKIKNLKASGPQATSALPEHNPMHPLTHARRSMFSLVPKNQNQRDLIEAMARGLQQDVNQQIRFQWEPNHPQVAQRIAGMLQTEDVPEVFPTYPKNAPVITPAANTFQSKHFIALNDLHLLTLAFLHQTGADHGNRDSQTTQALPMGLITVAKTSENSKQLWAGPSAGISKGFNGNWDEGTGMLWRLTLEAAQSGQFQSLIVSLPDNQAADGFENHFKRYLAGLNSVMRLPAEKGFSLHAFQPTNSADSTTIETLGLNGKALFKITLPPTALKMTQQHCIDLEHYYEQQQPPNVMQ